MNRIDIVLIDGFPLLPLSAITETLRIANRESMSREFRWRFLSPYGSDVRSSSGIKFSIESSLDKVPPDAVILLAAYNVEQSVEPGLINWLQNKARKNILMGCVDTGAYIFAKAGLLRELPAAVHHEVLAGYSTDFPKSLFTDKMFTFDPRLCSSAGGVPTIDMMLALVRHFLDANIAERVSQVLNYSSISLTQTQGLFPQEKLIPKVDRNLARCIEIMIANIDSPLSLRQISEYSSTTLSSMHRLFKRYLNTTPAKYYSAIRLEHARNLLRSSHEKVGVIALNCGFESLETFSRAYKSSYKIAPSKDRQWIS